MKNKKRFLNIFIVSNFPAMIMSKSNLILKLQKDTRSANFNNLSIFLNNSMLIFKLWFLVDPHKVGHSENTGSKAVDGETEVFICPVAVQLELGLQIIHTSFS